jgi:long-chain acyl-CoA synthetase
LVRMTGLEPVHLAALPPQSSVSANSTTCAKPAYSSNSLSPAQEHFILNSLLQPDDRRDAKLFHFSARAEFTKFASMNLVTAFGKTAQSHPKKAAIFWGDEEFSYELLFAQTALAATKLQALGVKPGDRVGLWLKNCPEFVPAIFSILACGAVAVPINNFLKPDEIEHILTDADINVIVTDSAMAEHLPALTALRPQLQYWIVDELAKPENRTVTPSATLPSVANNVQRDDLAVIIYTSGTTGKSKGAMLTHGNLLHNVDSCRQVMLVMDHDRFVVLLPMFHSFMLCVGVMLPLITGGSMVLIRSLHPPKNIIADIFRRQATILPAVPSFFRTLAAAEMPPGLPLRICISGGAPLPVEILREFNRKMPIPLIEGYGLSEASPVVSLNPIQGPQKEGSIGKPIPDVEVTIQDDDGNILPIGSTGEVCVRGGNVMRGYWNQPEATAKTIRNGWLLTGDVGHGDAEGFFYITDRKKDMLIVNGINVYPREIEEILYHIPGVKEAAVVGVPDPRRGEHPVAFVAPNDGVTLDEREILNTLRQKLADYKVPKKINFVAALPRNPTGKVLKRELRQQV